MARHIEHLEASPQVGVSFSRSEFIDSLYSQFETSALKLTGLMHKVPIVRDRFSPKFA